MSEADRRKWDLRYAEGAYEGRTHPNALLAHWLPELPVGRALDIACGAGRNALFLAAAGFAVDAVDVSGQALERGQADAEARGLRVNWIRRDLDAGLPDTGRYDVIIMFRYVNPTLLATLEDRLRPGGYLLIEEHLVTDADVIGPRGARFRVEPGALAAAAGDLSICFSEEGLVADPDGRSAALARLVARKPEL